MRVRVQLASLRGHWLTPDFFPDFVPPSGISGKELQPDSYIQFWVHGGFVGTIIIF